MSKRIITLGKWENKPIDWIVLKEENNNALVISRLPLFAMDCRNNGTTMDWEYSVLREYLNGELYNKAFSSTEKLKIVNAKLEDVKSSKDNIFLLSKVGAENLLNKTERSIHSEWLLRSAHTSKSTSIWFVQNSGDFDYYQGYSITQVMGVVAAMYIKE